MTDRWFHLEGLHRRGRLKRGQVGEHAVAVHAGLRPFSGTVTLEADAPKTLAQSFDLKFRRAKRPRKKQGGDKQARREIEMLCYHVFFLP